MGGLLVSVGKKSVKSVDSVKSVGILVKSVGVSVKVVDVVSSGSIRLGLGSIGGEKQGVSPAYERNDK